MLVQMIERIWMTHQDPPQPLFCILLWDDDNLKKLHNVRDARFVGGKMRSAAREITPQIAEKLLQRGR